MAVIKRKGVYWVDYYYRDESGRQRRRREAVGTSRKLADEVLKKRLAEIAERRFFPERQQKLVKLKDAAKDYMDWARSNVGEKTRIRFEVSMKALNAAFGDRYLNEIRPTDVERFKADRLKTVKPATVNRDLAQLKHLYNLILKGKILADVTIDPTLPARISLLRENNSRLRYLTEKEYKELLIACGRVRMKQRVESRVRTADLKSIIVTAVHTGMRREEILSLKWSDLDLDGRVITIHKAKWGSQRQVPVNSVLAATLASMARRVDSPYVFCHQEEGKRAGERIKEFKRSWAALVKASGIVNMRFHDLRHTCASWLVMRGVPLKTVQEILGHRSFVTTLRYAHLSPELRTQAVEKLCDLDHRHILDTQTPLTEGKVLRPAANDGTTTSCSEGGGGRTHGPRFKRPLLYL